MNILWVVFVVVLVVVITEINFMTAEAMDSEWASQAIAPHPPGPSQFWENIFIFLHYESARKYHTYNSNFKLFLNKFILSCTQKYLANSLINFQTCSLNFQTYNPKQKIWFPFYFPKNLNNSYQHPWTNLIKTIVFHEKVICYLKNFVFYKEKSKKMQQRIKILFFHTCIKLNMFRATHRPSSEA
jgi:hypothetical protein